VGKKKEGSGLKEASRRARKKELGGSGQKQRSIGYVKVGPESYKKRARGGKKRTKNALQQTIGNT